MRRLQYMYLIATFLLLANSGNCLNLYVSPSGSDSNPGTQAAPLASLAGARDRIREIRSGRAPEEIIQVIIEDGEYHLSKPLILSFEDSGTKAYPVIYSAAKGATPKFIGGRRLSGWELVNENLWRVRVPELLHIEQFYVNDRLAIRARTPNQGFFKVKDVKETILDQGSGARPDMSMLAVGLYPEDAAQLGDLNNHNTNRPLAVFYHKWDNTRAQVGYFDTDSSVLYAQGRGMKPWNKLNSKSRYFIENHKAGLDEPGEWYHDADGYLYYIPEKGESVENIRAIIPTVETLIQGAGDSQSPVAHVRFEGLTFSSTGYQTPYLGNEPAQAASPIGAAITLDHARNISFVRCTFSQIATYAIWFRKDCRYSSVNQCLIFELGAGGVKIGELKQPENQGWLTRDIIVDNTIIRAGGKLFPCAAGIAIFHSSDNQITHNDIGDLRYTGISVGWVWGYKPSPSKRNQIKYNHIHHLGWGELSDMGGVYCLGESKGTVVSHNVIHDILSYDYGGWGLYTDEGSSDILMEKNMVYSCKSSGFHQHYGKNNVIRNNIFANNQLGQLQTTKVEDHLSFSFVQNIVWFDDGELLKGKWSNVNMVTDWNCYWDARNSNVKFDGSTFQEWQSRGYDEHSMIADPEPIDPQSDNYYPGNQSVLRKIKFESFDPMEAGVYGSSSWQKQAKLDSTLIKRFEERSAILEHNR